MSGYLMFMMGQWFLLGKEIDHRLKIYYRVNSSIDRVIYRLLLGMIFMIIYFNIVNFLPFKWVYNVFWVTWGALGLFYSWPTRGKIIEESVSSNFSEFRYLDSFEKTLLALICALFFISIPQVPELNNFEALKLFFDPKNNINSWYWNFLSVSYIPFWKYPSLFRMATSLHFYVVGCGMFLLCLYGLLRFLVSRRLSLLGVFALISSWSFSKILAANISDSIAATFLLLWIWSTLWAAKSSTYRSGLFLGLIIYYGSLINSFWSIVGVINLALFIQLYIKEKTMWFKRQVIKYASFGIILSVIVGLFSDSAFIEHIEIFHFEHLSYFKNIITRKAFYSLSIFGLIIIGMKYISQNNSVINRFNFDIEKLEQILISFFFVFLLSFFCDHSIVKTFGFMWPVVLFSLLPIELIFQSITRLRSKRNMIYAIYIIICLADSHIEGRVKILARFLKNF